MFDIVQNVTSRYESFKVHCIPGTDTGLAYTYRNIKMTRAQNGARIKTWAGPNVGSGIVKNVTFEDFVETSVDHPVVIDQV